jgi:hypothetical protein
MTNPSPTFNRQPHHEHASGGYPKVELTEQMISAAKAMVDKVRVKRTVASKIDTLAGILGEFAFAQYFFGDWTKNRVGSNKGDIDFTNIEIKTSAFPFRGNLNLLVREDYAQKRKPVECSKCLIHNGLGLGTQSGRHHRCKVAVAGARAADNMTPGRFPKSCHVIRGRFRESSLLCRQHNRMARMGSCIMV